MWSIEKTSSCRLLGLTVILALIAPLLFSTGCTPEKEAPVPQTMTTNTNAKADANANVAAGTTEVNLPAPRFDSDVSIEETLLKRRSIRRYTRDAITLQDVSQLLWAAQGITERRGGYGLRTAPSAGALYPLETYVVVGNVQDLAPGVYRYLPEHHRLTRVAGGDLRADLAAAALGQDWVRQGAAIIVFTAVYERTTGRYGERGIMYVHMEVGHAAQNVCLQAVALNLGTVVVGAFYDDRVRDILKLPKNEQPLYIIPVGKPR